MSIDALAYVVRLAIRDHRVLYLTFIPEPLSPEVCFQSMLDAYL